MSETFKASNGEELNVAPTGHLIIPPVTTGLGERTQQALREFFQHERDKELGRWRDPENLHRVAYATSPHTVFIMDESTGQGAEYSRQTVNDSSANYGDRLKRQSARAYFAAHPEPKPWHFAKPGEVWVLVVNGEEYPWGFDGRDQRFIYAGGESWLRHNDDMITAGRRIWPEVPDGA